MSLLSVRFKKNREQCHGYVIGHCTGIGYGETAIRGFIEGAARDDSRAS